MGLLRFYLAFSVFLTHMRIYRTIPFCPFAYTAVCCFFIVSGFYMSLVIANRYGLSRGGISAFYINRVMRILPIYLATVAIYQVFRWMPSLFTLGPWSLVETLKQTTLFPAVLWNTITLQPGANALVVGQAVTIGIEMIFYMTVPLLALCRTRALLLIWFVGFCFLQAPTLLNLPARPWQYEFAPTVFVFFVTGALSFRLWHRLKDKVWLAHTAPLFGLAIPLVCALTESAQFDWVRRPAVYLLYATVAFAIPALFAATKSIRLDRLIGDLSYPMYLIQNFVMVIICGRDGTPTTTASRFAVMAVTLALSAALVLLIDRPVERLRERVARRSGVSAPSLLKTAPATP